MCSLQKRKGKPVGLAVNCQAFSWRVCRTETMLGGYLAVWVFHLLLLAEFLPGVYSGARDLCLSSNYVHTSHAWPQASSFYMCTPLFYVPPMFPWMEEGFVCPPGKDVSISSNACTLMCLFPGGNNVFLLRPHWPVCNLVHSVAVKSVVDGMPFPRILPLAEWSLLAQRCRTCFLYLRPTSLTNK